MIVKYSEGDYCGSMSFPTDLDANGWHPWDSDMLTSTTLRFVCDPDAGRGMAEIDQERGFENPICNFNIVWRSKNACRQCTDDDLQEVFHGKCADNKIQKETSYNENGESPCVAPIGSEAKFEIVDCDQQPTSSKADKGGAPGWVAGVVVVCLMAVAGMAGAAFFFYRRSKHSGQHADFVPMDSLSNPPDTCDGGTQTMTEYASMDE